MQGNRGGGGQGSVSSAIRFGPLFLRSGAAATPKSVETLGGSTAKQPQRVPFRQRVASPAKVLKLPHAFVAEISCSPVFSMIVVWPRVSTKRWRPGANGIDT